MSTTEKRRQLAGWLRTSSAADIVDDAVMGCLPSAEAEDLLRDFGIEPTREELVWLGREIDDALTSGEA